MSSDNSETPIADAALAAGMPVSQDHPQFGGPGCTCKPLVSREGKLQYPQKGDTVDQISGWDKDPDCPIHAPRITPSPGKLESKYDHNRRDAMEWAVQLRKTIGHIDGSSPKFIAQGVVEMAQQIYDWLTEENK